MMLMMMMMSTVSVETSISHRWQHPATPSDSSDLFQVLEHKSLYDVHDTYVLTISKQLWKTHQSRITCISVFIKNFISIL